MLRIVGGLDVSRIIGPLWGATSTDARKGVGKPALITDSQDINITVVRRMEVAVEMATFQTLINSDKQLQATATQHHPKNNSTISTSMPGPLAELAVFKRLPCVSPNCSMSPMVSEPRGNMPARSLNAPILIELPDAMLQVNTTMAEDTFS